MAEERIDGKKTSLWRFATAMKCTIKINRKFSFSSEISKIKWKREEIQSNTHTQRIYTASTTKHGTQASTA